MRKSRVEFVKNSGVDSSEQMYYNNGTDGRLKNKAVRGMNGDISKREYAGRPNLLRVAKELAKFAEPHKAADTLLFVLKGCPKDAADTE